MNMSPTDTRPGYAFTLFLLFLTLLCSGSVPVFLRFLLKPGADGGLGLDPWIVNALRYASAPIFWFPFVMMRRRPVTAGSDDSPSRADVHFRGGVWRAAMVPTFFNLVTQVCWGAVGKYSDANMIGFVARLAFPFTVLYSFLLFPGERRLIRRPGFWIGGIGTLVGLVLLSAEKLGAPGSGGTTFFGFFLLFLMAIFWGGYTVSVKKQMAVYSSIYSFWVISAYTTAGLLVLMFLFGDFASFRKIDLGAWEVLAASSLVGVTFWHVMYYRALKGLGAIVSDGVLMASPFLTVVGSSYFLGETLSPIQAVGGFVLVGGGVLLVIVHGRATREMPTNAAACAKLSTLTR